MEGLRAQSLVRVLRAQQSNLCLSLLGSGEIASSLSLP